MPNSIIPSRSSLQTRSDIYLIRSELLYNLKNDVDIDEDWKDIFPQKHPTSKWVRSPGSKDSTPYLDDGVLSHYARNPNNTPPVDFLWTRIPKRLRDRMSSHNDLRRTGWALVMNEECHQTAIQVFWGRILAIGAVGPGLCLSLREEICCDRSHGVWGTACACGLAFSNSLKDMPNREAFYGKSSP